MKAIPQSENFPFWLPVWIATKRTTFGRLLALAHELDNENVSLRHPLCYTSMYLTVWRVNNDHEEQCMMTTLTSSLGVRESESGSAMVLRLHPAEVNAVRRLSLK